MKLSCIGVILLVTLAVQIQPVPGSYITSAAKIFVTRIAEYYLKSVHPKDRTLGATLMYLRELQIIIEENFLKKLQISKKYSEKILEKLPKVIKIYQRRFIKRRIFSDSPRSLTEKRKYLKLIAHTERRFLRNIEQLVEKLNQLVVKYAMRSRFWTKY